MVDRLRVIVSGLIVRVPLGGMAWHYLQYALGLAQLGHDVHFLEDSDDYEESCYDPSRHITGPDASYGLRFAETVFSQVGLASRWAYFDTHGAGWIGPCASSATSVAENADVFLNVSGTVPVRPWLSEIPLRIFIDTDPAFEQIRQLTIPGRRARALKHNAFLTFGGNVATDRSLLPADGIDWRPTRQPIVLDQWPVSTPPVDGAFTTVMQWDSYPTREYGGVEYGMKSQSVTEYLDLPGRVDADLELALGSADAPRKELRARGWRLRNPLEVTADPWTYQSYISQSMGEFSVAKHGYVVSNSGWFSERSAAYLASGRPVAVQSTGFESWLPVGAGVLSFSDIDGAATSIDRIRTNPTAQGAAAREIAEEYFDSSRVLTKLIDDATRLAGDPL